MEFEIPSSSTTPAGDFCFLAHSTKKFSQNKIITYFLFKLLKSSFFLFTY
nr:MAG TPA: hypothetical protein [Caudoviricetes sp.]